MVGAVGVDLLKLCDHRKDVGHLCKLLQEEDTIHINEILDYFLEEYPVEEMEEHYSCTERNCGIRVFERFFGYFKLYMDVPEFQDRLNNPAFPARILESLVIYLISHRHPDHRKPESIVDQYLYFLTPGRIVDLISSTDIITREPEFTLGIMGRLDNRSMDDLLSRSEKIRAQLTGLFMESDPERISMILSTNPVIYDYIIMFLELDGKEKESEDFQNRYGQIIEAARKLRQLTDEIKKLDRSTDPENRGKRISYIIGNIQETEDPERVFDILDRHQVFLDIKEREVIHMLLTDTGMQEFLKLRDLEAD